MEKRVDHIYESMLHPVEVSGMVKILFYTSDPKKFGTEITCMLAMSAENSFEFQSVYASSILEQLLQSEGLLNHILILAALSHEELDKLFQLRSRFSDLPIVLLLADDNDETLQRAHMFRPKFLSTIHNDFKDVISVVEKLGKGVGNYSFKSSSCSD